MKKLFLSFLLICVGIPTFCFASTTINAYGDNPTFNIYDHDTQPSYRYTEQRTNSYDDDPMNKTYFIIGCSFWELLIISAGLFTIYHKLETNDSMLFEIIYMFLGTLILTLTCIFPYSQGGCITEFITMSLLVWISMTVGLGSLK